MPSQLLARFKIIIKKPPRIILQRVVQEICSRVTKYTTPFKIETWNIKKVLKENKAFALAKLWQRLGTAPFIIPNMNPEDIARIPFENLSYIQRKADLALQRQIDLLGTGLIQLGIPIDWQKDYKTNKRWPQEFFKQIEYNNLELPSDVKIPWEISRLQWVIPLGQMYLLTKDEKYAIAVKAILLDWIQDNPYAFSVNWSCTMEVAIRIIVWTWLFHAFWQSHAWQDISFQNIFIINLYLHCDFTQKNLEKSSVNGNHYIADAAGLVFGGLFFSSSKRAKKWHALGWQILNEEIEKQVSTDGVDYEASVPYHRLVTEIFFFPALLRLKKGFSISNTYQKYLFNMADYIAHYSRNDGSVPLVGDADDARILPFGEQGMNDHRYLIGLISLGLHHQNLGAYFDGPTGEIFWLYGDLGVQKLNGIKKIKPTCKAFKEGGYFIIRNAVDHVFIDCAPIGLQGMGGHGHNDCLSFEAMLDNTLLIVDSGAYVYTASFTERNYFRSTAAHNTPLIDQVEINRFIAPNFLWTLHDEAKPELLSWESNAERSIFYGGHSGYMKLKSPVKNKRVICLNHMFHTLVIVDDIECSSTHTIQNPFHFHPNMHINQIDDHHFIAQAPTNARFNIYLTSTTPISSQIKETEFSPSYGIKQKSSKILIETTANASLTRLIIGIKPEKVEAEVLTNEMNYFTTPPTLPCPKTHQISASY